MWTALHVAVLVAIYCATAQTEPQARASSQAEANDASAKQVDVGDLRPNQAEANNTKPNPPEPLYPGNGGPGDRQDRWSEHEDMETRETKMSKQGSVYDITLVESVPKRKRTISLEGQPYPHVICYFFTPAYNDTTNRITFRKATDFIASRVCITFIDITQTVNVSDPNSPTKLGCRTNAYLRVIVDSSCYAPTGMPTSTDAGSNTISPCGEFTVTLHEIEHVVLAIHVHMGSIALTVFSILIGNVQPQYGYAFGVITSTGYSIDCASTQRYPSTYLSNNGGLTLLPMRPDLCSAADYLSTEETLMAEFNLIYKCNEYVCGNSTIDCFPGYYAMEDGLCQCICPKFLDRKTNCKTLVNGTFGPTWWPTKATFLSGGNNVECPVGTIADGTLSICGNASAVNPGPTPFASANSSKITYLQFCSVTNAKSDDMYEWPAGGNLCFIKPKGIPCTGRFNNFTISYTNFCPVSYNGTAAEISVVGNLTTIVFCCKEETADLNVNLPNNQAFTLAAYTRCPKIEGMQGQLAFLAFNVANRKYSGGPYKIFIYDLPYGFYWYMCFQRPSIYGCNLYATFDITQRSVTYVSPGYPVARQPNTRCLIFAFLQLDFAGVVKLTVNNMSLESADLLAINRWGIFTSKSYFPTNPTPIDLMSEEYFFQLELYTTLATSTKPGINITLEARLAAEFIYNFATKGANYIGTKNVTEYGRPCLPWKYASSCHRYPRATTDEVLGYATNNYCRNFGGLYKQPWCYTYINGSNCVKDYCDVNEFQQLQDKLPTLRCAAYVASTPGFCSYTIPKLLCARTCNFQTLTLDQCPPGYYPMGPRCVGIPPGIFNRTGAQAVCAGKGPFSGLFQILSKSDVQFIRQYRYLIANLSSEHMWIDGTQTGNTSELYYTGTDVPLLFKNFSTENNVDSLRGCSAALVSETQTPSIQGSTWAFPTNDPNFQLRVICQTLRTPACGQYVPPADGFVNDTRKPFYFDGDRLAVWCKNNAALLPVYTMCKNNVWTVVQSACADGQGNDKYGGACQEALARNGQFCQLPNTASICPLTCGANGVTAVCTAPSSSSYVRTSPNNTVANGQFMTFACASGRIFTGGDLVRGCGLNGSLLGQEPICESNPAKVTIGQDLLIQQVSSHLVNTVCLLDRDGYRVSIAGNLSAVYCMTVSVGSVTVVVYRKVGSTFTFVGYNQVFCEPGFTWYVPIPSNQQIPVQAGDVVGVHATVSNTLYEAQCDGFPDKSWQLPCAPAINQTALATANFTSTKCVRFALSYEVTSTASGSGATNSVATKLVNEATTSTTRATATSSSPTTTTTTRATTTTTRATKPTTTKRGFLLG